MALNTFPNDAGVAAPKPTRRGALDRPPAQRGGHPASCPYLGRPSLPPCSRGADRPRTGLGCGSGRCSVAVTIAERCGRPARHSLPTTKMAADASRAAPPRKMAARPHRPARPPGGAQSKVAALWPHDSRLRRCRKRQSAAACEGGSGRRGRGGSGAPARAGGSRCGGNGRGDVAGEAAAAVTGSGGTDGGGEWG